MYIVVGPYNNKTLVMVSTEFPQCKPLQETYLDHKDWCNSACQDVTELDICWRFSVLEQTQWWDGDQIIYDESLQLHFYILKLSSTFNISTTSDDNLPETFCSQSGVTSGQHVNRSSPYSLYHHLHHVFCNISFIST